MEDGGTENGLFHMTLNLQGSNRRYDFEICFTTVLMQEILRFCKKSFYVTNINLLFT